MKKDAKKPKRKSILERINQAAESVGNAAKRAGIAAVELGDSAYLSGTAAVDKFKHSDLSVGTTKIVSDATSHLSDSALNASSIALQKLKDVDSSKVLEEGLRQALKVPLVKIERSKFLHRELIKSYPQELVLKAVAKNPAFAGVDRLKISEIADRVINSETNRVATVSFSAGFAGGFAMAATVPAYIAQYIGFLLRIMQELAYLYGFDEFFFYEGEVDEETLNEIIVFIGAMFGVQGSEIGVQAIAQSATNSAAKSPEEKEIMKKTIAPIVKTISQEVGVKLTKQIFAESASKIVPIVGGVVSGGVTYATFKPLSHNLKRSFQELDLSNPEYYKQIAVEAE